jgi:ABC-2 type transport system permease protein
MWALDVQWTAPRVALACYAVVGGACLFTGLLVVQATVAFWTIDSLEAMNTVTYGGVETSQLPMSIYRPWFRRFFTFVVPLACVSYFPALGVLGREGMAPGWPVWFFWSAPTIGVLFLAASLGLWRFGVRRYCSTGS